MGRNYPGWEGFKKATWANEINVRSFIRHNYTPYDGDDSFLVGPTQDTLDLWDQVMDLTKQEREAGGVLDMDTKIISTITSHGPGYLNKDKERIVGFQTDKPFKRALMPYGGIRMAEKACADNGYEVDPQISEFFSIHRKTHNAGVFDAYTPEMRACRSSHIITGLPDAYGRGRIIGDYRRVALYGVDRLIEDKEEQKRTTRSAMYSDVIRDREELSEQIRALHQLKQMAASYGFDISQPATNVQEAIQWLYFGYLAAIKTQNGAAMSVGRVATFLDIYFKRDIDAGIIRAPELATEQATKELIHFARISKNGLGYVRTAINETDPDKFEETRGKLVKYEEISDRIEYEIAAFLNAVSTGEISESTMFKIKSMYKIIGELESLGDSGESISRILSRKNIHKKEFDAESIKNLNTMAEAVNDAYEVMITNLNAAHKGELVEISNAYNAEERLNNLRNDFRDAMIEDLENNRNNYQSNIYYIDIINAYEQMGDFMINISQDLEKAFIEK